MLESKFRLAKRLNKKKDKIPGAINIKSLMSSFAMIVTKEKAGGMKHPARFYMCAKRPLVRVRVAVTGARFFFLFRLLGH